ncbi:MAG: group II intron reverse transcriptase/maturase [Bryobacterales bacterium]|nr:group II intron reverse transcriptase/maturase [Bryobacterales bacterium]
MSGGRRPALRGASSDPTVGKRANKPGRPGAEPVERRGSIKGKAGSRDTGWTLGQETVQQVASRIRRAVERNPRERLTALLHHINHATLREAYFGLKRAAAAGVDRVTWKAYGEGLEERLLDLQDRVHSGAYRARPVRRVEIPKPDGSKRPLGITALEDKILQKAVVDCILTPIFEAEFLGFSYGFRPGRGAHDALDALAYAIQREKVNWIVDADIRGYFDAIDRGWLVRFLEHRIGDRRVVRLIQKWLRAGVMQDGAWSDSGVGTPQAANVSPVLANVVLHYVLDLWFHRRWRPQVPRGKARIVRYADDFVVGFQHKEDAERFLGDLKERLARFGLELHPKKTRLVEFGRFAAADRKSRGQGKPETFDFLGFTHYVGKTRRGWFRLGRKPVAKRMGRTLQRIRAALRRRWHDDIWEVGQWLGQVVDGWLNYYAVPGSSHWLSAFVLRVKRLWMRALRRRSQRDRTAWSKLERMTELLWPRARIRHPWPDRRFAVKHLR